MHDESPSRPLLVAMTAATDAVILLAITVSHFVGDPAILYALTRA